MNNIEIIKLLLNEEMRLLTDIKKRIEVKGDDMTVREHKLLIIVKNAIERIEIIKEDSFYLLENEIKCIKDYLRVFEF